jgi:hypothetical protein
VSAKGSPAWYRDRRESHIDPAEQRERRRKTARARGEFDEYSERAAFEAFYRHSRSGKGATYLDLALRRHPERPSEYESDPTQRHWFTWQMAVGAGRLLPRFDPMKAAVERLAAEQAERHHAEKPASAPTEFKAP